MVSDVTMENYAEFQKGKAVLDFWASWCGPCMAFKPTFEEVSNERTDIKFGKVNTEEPSNATLAGQFGIRSIPTVVFLQDGKEVGRFSGAYPKEMFLKEIDKAFQ